MAEYVEDTGDGSTTLRRHTPPTKPADTRAGAATVAAATPPAPVPAPVAAPGSEAGEVASGVRVRVLVPLAATLLLLVVAFVWVFVLETQSRQAEDMARTAASVEAMLQKKSTDGVALMRSVMELTMSDTRLAQAFRARDRDTLLALSTPLLDELRSRNRITHFYYILPDSTILLRVQSPELSGDKIERLVLREAQQTGQPAWGNEQGPLGTFPLRVVYPWRVRGELIGYLEMGIEFEDLMRSIRQFLGVDVFVALDKKLFDRPRFEQAQKSRLRPVQWDEFPGLLVLSRTIETMPPPVANYLRTLNGQHVKRTFEVSWPGNVAQAVVLPFANLRGDTLGEMVVVRDITTGAADRRNAILGVAALGVLMGGALMAAFYVLLGRVQHVVAMRTARLTEAQRVLTQEQLDRQRAEHGLRLQRERNDLLEARSHMLQDLVQAKRALEARTGELAHSISLLHATLDSTADGILATQFTGGSVCANAKFTQMWGIPLSMLARGVDAELFAYMAPQLKQPERFIARIEDLFACPQSEAFDVLELRDGRVFERYVKPQRIDGKAVGIVCNFRDITQRKRVEADLQAAQSKLESGQIDTGAALLNDVSEVLDRMKSSASAIGTQLRGWDAAGLGRAVRLLNEHAGDLDEFLTRDPKGLLLPAYLGELAQVLQNGQSGVFQEVEVLTQGVGQIRDLLSSQVPQAGAGGGRPTLQIGELLEDALRLHRSALARHGVKVVKEFTALPTMQLDRHRLLLILINLIGNAKHALLATSGREPSITLRVALLDGPTLRVEVQDNGAGMAPDQMARTFAPGFMHRSDGHGFSLHSCVVAAREMGGALTGRSDGPGTGSTFTLELPVAGPDDNPGDSRPALMEPGSKGRNTAPLVEPPASPQPA